MAEKTKKEIDKQKRLKEINEKIKACDVYIHMDPDPTAKQRVEALTKNPCASGMFYLNAIYKDDFQCSEEEAKEYAKKYRSEIIKELPYQSYIVDIYDIKDNGFFSSDTANYYTGLPKINQDMITYINYEPLLKAIGENVLVER